MDRDDIIKMAKEAWLRRTGCVWTEPKCWSKNELVRFAELVAAAEREKVAAWMMGRGYATGHGDTIEELLQELEWQIAEKQEPVARVCYGQFTLTQTDVGIGDRGMQAYEEAKKRGWVCESEGARGEQ